MRGLICPRSNQEILSAAEQGLCRLVVPLCQPLLEESRQGPSMIYWPDNDTCKYSVHRCHRVFQTSHGFKVNDGRPK